VDEAYQPARTAVVAAVHRCFDAGLGHAVLIEALRDVATELERGDLARDPFGARDSRLIDARETAARVTDASGGQRAVHLVTAGAGRYDSLSTWVHSIHASIADAQALAERLNRLAERVREAGPAERREAIHELIKTDPRHGVIGLPLDELIGLPAEMLLDPGTTYALESRKLEFGGPATFDVAARLADKQAARDKDDADLAAGHVSAEELQRRNSFATGLDLPNAVVRVPNPDAWDELWSFDEIAAFILAQITEVVSLAEEYGAPSYVTKHAHAAKTAVTRWVNEASDGAGQGTVSGE
jgi:hypothetical protein